MVYPSRTDFTIRTAVRERLGRKEYIDVKMRNAMIRWFEQNLDCHSMIRLIGAVCRSKVFVTGVCRQRVMIVEELTWICNDLRVPSAYLTWRYICRTLFESYVFYNLVLLLVSTVLQICLFAVKQMLQLKKQCYTAYNKVFTTAIWL